MGTPFALVKCLRSCPPRGGAWRARTPYSPSRRNPDAPGRHATATRRGSSGRKPRGPPGPCSVCMSVTILAQGYKSGIFTELLAERPVWALCLLVRCQTWPGQVAALFCSYLQPKYTFPDQLLWWHLGYSKLWLLLPERLGHPCLIYHISFGSGCSCPIFGPGHPRIPSHQN